MNNNSFYGNAVRQVETNYSIMSENVDIWEGEFPFKTGDTFPTDKIKERADISYTNKLLYSNNYNKTLDCLLDLIPETNLVYGMKLREIVANLPYFKTVTDAYIGLCCTPLPIIDTPDKVDVRLSELVGNSNMGIVLQSMFKSLFMDTIDAYKIGVSIDGRPNIMQIPNKNLIVYNSPDDLSSILCVVIFNIIKDKIEFIEYWHDGKIIKRVFEYSNNTIGVELGEPVESEAFGGLYRESPIVVVKHNTESINDTYGVDQFRYWDAGVSAVCRAVSNLLRVNERCREIIRKLPEGALDTNIMGANRYVNRGVITYPDGMDKSMIPEIEYIIPNIQSNIESCSVVLDKSLKQLSSSSALSPIWFDFEKVGSNLSAKSINAVMLPTMLNAKRISDNMTTYVKDIVHKVGLTGGIDIDKSSIDINWSAGIEDEDSLNEIINMRLNNGTISKEDAIIKLDKVSRRVAKERINKINNIQSPIDGSNKSSLGANIVSNSDIAFSNVSDKEKVGTAQIPGTAIPADMLVVTPPDERKIR